VNAHQRAFAFKFLMCHGISLELIGQADSGHRKQ
jgi:hypothetical protein